MGALATTADLDARGIISNFAEVEVFLDVASTAVRDAAGTNITRDTSTVTVTAYPGDRTIRLPGPPIVSVDDVTIDGKPAEGWDMVDAGVWRQTPWTRDRPVQVDVTYTHGLEDVPDDIVHLVCSMVAAAKTRLDSDPDGLGLAADNGRRQSVTIDNFSETYATSADAMAVANEMVLPRLTREWLRKRFGGGASSTATR